jgi:hypothetical protein
MDFCDCSPSSSPSADQQRDALQKGLGRAWQWALNGRLGEGRLLDACLQDLRFDMQCEGPRAGWLWQIIEAAGAAQGFRVSILHALHDLSNERNASQLCELARWYANIGDGAFRDRLYEIVEQRPFPDSPWLGEKEIVALDGEPAFLFVARIRGQQLGNREWEWDDRSLVDQAIDRLGEERVRGLLETSTDAGISRFREGWRRQKQRADETKEARSHRERMKGVAVEEIVRAAEGDTNCYWFRGWGMYANESDLKVVLQRLWTLDEPRIITNMVKVFSARPLPEFDARLIELCRHNDDQVRRRAFRALEQNAHPLVRQFAESELKKGIRDSSVLGLFIKNYRRGDEQRILEALDLPNDPCELHWLLMDVNKVLEKNSDADCSRLAVITYGLTPCSNCRLDAARLVHQQRVAPDWLKEECRFDCEEDCRKLF